MQITPEQAADIMRQIQSNQWKWLGVKRFIPEAYPTIEERYAALEKHHTAETTRMIEVITALCEAFVSKTDDHATAQTPHTNPRGGTDDPIHGRSDKRA